VYSVPIVFDALVGWEGRVADRFGAGVLERLGPWSLDFAMNQRKWQIETFRALVPDGGYVVSVARDFRLAQMGLCDPLGRWKWPVEAWEWHGDTQLLLDPTAPAAIEAGTATYVDLSLSHHGPSFLGDARVEWTFGAQRGAFPVAAVAPGAVARVGTPALKGPAADRATPLELEARLSGGDARAANRWTIWNVPSARGAPAETDDGVEVTAAFDPDGWARLRAGARVLHLAAGGPGSFAVDDLWLLRGGPWFPPHPLTEVAPPQLFVDLVPRDLAPHGVVPLRDLLEHVDPIVAFWETHDLPEVRDHAFVFETRVGDGRLLVSTLDHAHGPAGAWLLAKFREHLRHGPPPARALPDALADAVAARLAERSIDLVAQEWSFRPGLPEDAAAGAPWTPLAIGRHWEGQGFPALDGFGTYRADVAIPEDWRGAPLFLHLGGADDAYEVFFDGAPKGSGGDVASRASAFDAAATLRLADAAEPGTHTLEVRVFDWHGAGGLHRALRLSTAAGGGAAFVNPR
jgi:hypothetical protein